MYDMQKAAGSFCAPRGRLAADKAEAARSLNLHPTKPSGMAFAHAREADEVGHAGSVIVSTCTLMTGTGQSGEGGGYKGSILAVLGAAMIRWQEPSVALVLGH